MKTHLLSSTAIIITLFATALPAQDGEEKYINALETRIITLNKTIADLRKELAKPKPDNAIATSKTSPAKVETVPAQVETMPAKVETVPAKIETMPAKYKTIPTKVETVPAQIDTIPTRAETMPAQIETVPTKYKTIPTKAETVPVQIETMPARAETMPDKIETVPAKYKTVPDKYEIASQKELDAIYTPPFNISEKSLRLVNHALKIYLFVERVKNLQQEVDAATIADIKQIIASIQSKLTVQERNHLGIFFAELKWTVTAAATDNKNKQTAIANLTPKCTGVKGEHACWIKIANKECYEWNSHPNNKETVTWSGNCKNGVVDGVGEEVWYNNGMRAGSGNGSFIANKKQGAWVEIFASGTTGKGSYVGGKRHGNWVWSFASGKIMTDCYRHGSKVNC